MNGRSVDDQLAPPGCWRRSKKGNLWTRLQDSRTATIFSRGDGVYGWCLSDGEGPHWSPELYPSEATALAALDDLLREEL